MTGAWSTLANIHQTTFSGFQRLKIGVHFVTNNCMKALTRERVMAAAVSLFSEHGYRGASVRDICNLAGVNPGAVSYHFGGKRQLYRAVLRRAAEKLASAAKPSEEQEGGEHDPRRRIQEMASKVQEAVESDPASVRLIMRDLADGGTAAVEALTPSLRRAHHWLGGALGYADTPQGAQAARLAFAEIAAPIFLLNGAWPVLQRSLGLDDTDRNTLLEKLLRRATLA